MAGSKKIILKTASDLAQMRIACEAAAQVLNAVAEMVEPGRTTQELDEAAAKMIRAWGGSSPFYRYRHPATPKPFPGHICVSVNEEVVHGVASKRRIQYGDIVSLDVGIILNGWVGDTATTVAVGVVDPQVQELLTATEEALTAAIAKARPGNRLGDISHAVQSFVEARGFSVVRAFTGHGVGRSMHEEPQIPNFGRAGTGVELRPGMTLAIEPMVNMGAAAVEVLADGWTVVTKDGLPSAHFEHTIVVSENGAEILTCLKQTPYKSKAQS